MMLCHVPSKLKRRRGKAKAVARCKVNTRQDKTITITRQDKTITWQDKTITSFKLTYRES
jgi:hypothetical protein